MRIKHKPVINNIERGTFEARAVINSVVGTAAVYPPLEI